MNTTAQIRPPRTPIGPKQPTDPRRSARASDPERRALGEMVEEIVPLTELIPFYGPPAVFLLGPWLLLVLLLAAPFACLFALVVVMIVAATVLAALTAAVLTILAAPSRLVGHVRRHAQRHASIGAPAAQVLAIESPRVAA